MSEKIYTIDELKLILQEILKNFAVKKQYYLALMLKIRPMLKVI